ncbi:hypothetical protein LguiA_000502 [Lonicera macranthoides]
MCPLVIDRFDLAEEIDQEIISIRRYEPKSGSEGSVECAVCLSGIEEGNEIREIRYAATSLSLKLLASSFFRS